MPAHYLTTETGTRPRHIAIVGNALPRRCGLATYTSNSVAALIASFPAMTVDHYAMDDGHGPLDYGPNIRLIAQHDRSAYVDAAHAIEDSGAELIWLQHEFGIFGGPAGDHILTLLDRTSLPVVVTLHTLLTEPNRDEDRVFRALLARSARLIVMAQRGRDILIETYGVAADRIAVITHGVPDRPMIAAAAMRERLALAPRSSIMTFGLLAPSKGIGTVIEALPGIVRQCPDVLYYVLGATHPALLRHEGEAYRASLMARAEALGVAAHLCFIDRFFDEDLLLDYLRAADVYVTPYCNPQQITSGALSYAVAMGKPVVSTPYVHAREILAGGRGRIVPFDDVAAFEAEIGALLADEGQRLALGRRAWEAGRAMVWRENARNIVAVMAAAVADQPVALHGGHRALDQAPVIDLTAVARMTDDTGMIQHSVFGVPDRSHGYCIDDNARALILAVRAARDARATALATVYAAFVQHGWNPDRSAFRNFMRFDRTWCEDAGSEDSNGRALWALGVAADESPVPLMRDWAANLFGAAAGLADRLGSPRAIAFAMIGASSMLAARPHDDQARAILARGGDTLCALLERSRRPDWAWFEAVLAYDNARLPEALIRAGMMLGRTDYVDTGIATLTWIGAKQTAPRGHFRAVGTDSFGRAYAAPRPYDQQPLEAHAMVDACGVAYRATGDERWIDAARSAFDWFLGRNDRALALATPVDGGCFDGLGPQGVNRNQGAESILAFQLAACTIAALPQKDVDRRRVRVHAV